MSKCEGYRTGLVEINVEERPDTEAVLVEIVALGALWRVPRRQILKQGEFRDEHQRTWQETSDDGGFRRMHIRSRRLQRRKQNYGNRSWPVEKRQDEAKKAKKTKANEFSGKGCAGPPAAKPGCARYEHTLARPRLAENQHGLRPIMAG